MRVSTWLTVFLTVMPAVVAAQSTTADGVRAYVAGDYAAAARILRPLAEDSATPDPLAAFFLATLYEAGKGVRLDPIRACSLYLKAAASQNPFSADALQLADWMRSHGYVPNGVCEAAAATVWGRPAPIAFTLGDDHSVSIDAGGVTVRYQGAQKTTEMMLGGGPGWVYLPTRYTRLETSRLAETRHFIEFFVWIPRSSRFDPLISDNATWTLQWMICEISGTELIELAAGGPLATSEDERPSTTRPVPELARLLMNASGQVEWVAQGAFPARGILAARVSR